jgi:hypothetical protein
MKPRISLLSSQEQAARPYPEPDEPYHCYYWYFRYYHQTLQHLLRWPRSGHTARSAVTAANLTY